MISTEDCTFGEVYAFNRAECQITISNRSDRSFRISDVSTDVPEDKISLSEPALAPHAKVYLTVSAYTGNGIANVRHIVRFRTDEAGHEKRLAMARGFVSTVLDDAKPAFNFGVVDSEKPKTKRLELTSHDVADFRLGEIISAPDYVNARVDSDGHTVQAELRPDAPWGYRLGYIKLRTNTAVQEEVWIGVEADIHGAVVANANPFDLGLMRVGNRNEHLIRLESRDGKPFAIGNVQVNGFKGATSTSPCNPEHSGCRLLKLVVADDQTLGTLKGELLVSFPDYQQTMRIAIWGLLVDKDTKIETLDNEKLAKQSSVGGQSKQSESLNIKSALGDVVTAAAEEAVPPSGTGPLLKWTVANEMLIHGYQIFRGPDEKGPFLLLNRSTIPVKTNSNATALYQWRDNSAEAGKTYWYYIGMVYNDGHKQQLTGPQKVVAK